MSGSFHVIGDDGEPRRHPDRGSLYWRGAFAGPRSKSCRGVGTSPVCAAPAASTGPSRTCFCPSGGRCRRAASRSKTSGRPVSNCSAPSTIAAALPAARNLSTSILQRQVTQDARRHLATPFVMIIPDGAIGGCYLFRAPLCGWVICRRCRQTTAAPSTDSGTLIGRLAIDRRYHRQGWGNSCFQVPSIAARAVRSRHSL
jgi:hypothetical protein